MLGSVSEVLLEYVWVEASAYARVCSARSWGFVMHPSLSFLSWLRNASLSVCLGVFVVSCGSTVYRNLTHTHAGVVTDRVPRTYIDPRKMNSKIGVE
jgi:hypothetical protein